MSRIDALRRIVSNSQAQEIDAVLVDMQTAHMLVALHDALGAHHHDKFERMPLPKLLEFAASRSRNP